MSLRFKPATMHGVGTVDFFPPAFKIGQVPLGVCTADSREGPLPLSCSVCVAYLPCLTAREQLGVWTEAIKVMVRTEEALGTLA
jgi:hypothetical protein